MVGRGGVLDEALQEVAFLPRRIAVRRFPRVVCGVVVAGVEDGDAGSEPVGRRDVHSGCSRRSLKTATVEIGRVEKNVRSAIRTLVPGSASQEDSPLP